MPEHDQPGTFYLGQPYDLATGTTGSEPVRYDSRNLTTHAVCVGMTGSGKTGLCLSLLEEALLDGVGVIAIDPKGDLGNLLLVDPQFRPEVFQQWVDPGEAARKGKEPAAYASDVASQWKTGLASAGISDETIARYADIEKVIYTPGSSAGIPLSVLKSFTAPTAELLADSEALGERIASTVSGLLTLMGIAGDAVQSREHIFLSRVVSTAWQAGRSLSLADLIREIQSPPFDKVGIIDLDTFYPAADRTKLALALNNLLASPSFSGWIEGAPLDIGAMLATPDGKPRLSILSIAHLSDNERMFFVTLLLGELLAWMRAQPGTSSLRAIMYMDEVFGYFPPSANPPSKTPMLTLLKQARAFGLGCVLATQNPVDLDYKGLSNAGTWFLGRLQTERDKMRIIDGLEGAAATAGGKFNRQQVESQLAALTNRVFLMNNVHRDAPEIFKTRWAISYLRGPLTRAQIKALMDPLRDQFVTPTPATESGSVSATKPVEHGRPVLPGDVPECFVATVERVPADAKIEYRAALLGSAKLHYEKVSYGIDRWRSLVAVASLHESLKGNLSDDPWQLAMFRDEAPQSDQAPLAGASFGPLPSELCKASRYKPLLRDLEESLYRGQRLELWRAAALGKFSEAGEEQAAFRQRLTVELAAQRERELTQARDTYKRKVDDAQRKVDTAQAAYDTQRSQFWGRMAMFGYRVFDFVMAIVGGKASTRRGTTSATAARQAVTERSQSNRAKQRVDDAVAAREEIEAERERVLAQVADKYRPETIVLEPVELAPKKSDIDVDRVQLAWLPGQIDARGQWIPLW